jgi:hypothetical protein
MPGRTSRFAEAKITAIIEERPGLVRARAASADGEIEVVSFPGMTGPVEIGDRVIVNVTGILLGLGTGGVGFVLWNLDGPGPELEPEGHIMKVRYTPWQTPVLSAEAPESPHHELLMGAESIDGMPVVACSLHSQVAAAAAGVKAEAPEARVGYLMTDGAALPLAWSDLVHDLRESGLVDVTCTAGHAFGGDHEAVNVFSGLAVLHLVGSCDVVVAGMGPGVVGTGSTLGFTGMEQGQILDAASALEGKPIACLRISFADPRPRHRGLSHHSVTALRIAARGRATVVVPSLTDEQAAFVYDQLRDGGVPERHEIVVADGASALDELRRRGVEVSSMGRELEEIPELFQAAGAAGTVAAREV